MRTYLYLNNVINSFLVKQTFWDHVKEEARSIGDTFKDFFLMIKEYTYDIVADKIGGDMAGIILIGFLTLGIMIVLITLINR